MRQPDPLYLDFHLLDRQIVDAEGYLVGNVDDVELAVTDDGRLRITALLSGQQVLGDRLGGRLGHWLSATARRLSPVPEPRPLRIPYELIDTVESEVTLTVSKDQFPEPALETWLRRHLIDRIPGARDAAQ